MKMLWLFDLNSDRFDVSDVKSATHKNRLVIRASIMVLIVFFVWASQSYIDQITRASGSVIASLKTQTVQPEEAGSIQRILVREGDVVSQGDVLVVLDRTESETSYLEAKSKRAAILATISRLEAEVLGQDLSFGALSNEYPEFVAAQKSLFKKRKQALDEDLAELKLMQKLAEKELSLNQALVADGHVSQTDVMRLERQVADIRSRKTNKKNEFFAEAQAELTKAKEELSSVEQSLIQRKRRFEQTRLTAPVDGIVKNIRVTTEGGVVRPGEEIMQIVPANDSLVIEAKVAPSDIAFIRQGDPATVKIDAYDYTIFGDLKGKLTYISADTLIDERSDKAQPYYRIQVKTDSHRFHGDFAKSLEILPGMTATVEVITGTHSVLSYITKPLVKTFSESLGER